MKFPLQYYGPGVQGHIWGHPPILWMQGPPKRCMYVTALLPGYSPDSKIQDVLLATSFKWSHIILGATKPCTFTFLLQESRCITTSLATRLGLFRGNCSPSISFWEQFSLQLPYSPMSSRTHFKHGSGSTGYRCVAASCNCY